MIYIVHKSYCSVINNPCACLGAFFVTAQGFSWSCEGMIQLYPKAGVALSTSFLLPHIRAQLWTTLAALTFNIPSSHTDFSETLQDACQLGIWLWLHSYVVVGWSYRSVGGHGGLSVLRWQLGLCRQVHTCVVPGPSVLSAYGNN